MPYIGNSHVVGDHINNFKVLDDISSYTETFDGSSTNVVSTSDETLRILEHRFVQGQRVTYNNGGGSNIGGLSSGTVYYVSFDTANTIKLATSLVNANNGTLINLTSAGGGTTHTLTAAFDGINTKFKLTHNGGESGRFNNATQLQVAINNVLQRPNSDPDNFTEGFAVERGNKIVFQTAPTSNDIFWGSIIANSLPTFDIDAAAVDNFTGDGSTTDFTLSRIPPNNASIIVTINGVFQHLSDTTTARAYSLEASVVKFTSAPGSGDEIQVRHTGFRGALGDIVTGFYGRTGNVTLIATDDILTRNINSSGIITASSFSGDGSGLIGVASTDNIVTGTAATFNTYPVDINAGMTVAGVATFAGNVSIAGTLTYEDVKNVDSVGLGTFREGIFLPDDKKIELGNAAGSGDLQISHNSSTNQSRIESTSGSLRINQVGNGSNISILATNVYLKNHNNNETFLHAVNNGAVSLYYDNSVKFVTSAKGIQVGTGSTIETNGQATFAGVTTFTGHSQFFDVFKVGASGAYPGATEGSKITKVVKGSDVRPASLTFDHGGSATLEIGSIQAAAIVGTNSHGANNKPLRFMTGMDIGTLTGGSIQMEIKNNAVNIFNDLDVDGHTNLDNVSVAGVSTFTGAITANGAIDLNADLDVDGHTNLDNLSVAGVSTFTGNADFSNAIDVTGDSTFSNQITLKKIRLNNSNSAMYWGTGAQNFRDSAAIGVAGATNFHVTGSAANDFCVSAKNGTRLVFGSGAGAISATQKRAQIDSDGTFRILKSLILSNNLNVAGITTITQDLDVDGHTNLDNVSIAGVVTATSYYGDGSNLSNVISGVDVKFEGASVGTGVTMLNFVGFNTVTPPASGLSTITSGQNLTIGVRSGSAVEASLTGTSFNVIARSGGNISINI